jgi:hypothetical protein
MLPATEARYAAVLGELADALVLWRAVEPSANRTTGRRAEPTVLCLCACPRQIRLRWSVLHGAPVLCGECGASFLPRSPRR